MTEPDPLLARLAALPSLAPPAELSQRITRAGHARLVPAGVHPALGLAVAACVLTYLGWALHFTSQLY
jgi:hypothetical protein